MAKLVLGTDINNTGTSSIVVEKSNGNLPDPTSHSGEFLTNNGVDASWQSIKQVPDSTGASQGDVLTLDSNGNAIWQTNSSSIVATTSVLLSSNWDNLTHSQTIEVSGLTANKNVLVSPAPSSTTDYITAGIMCTGQQDNTLTFTCTTNPSTNITVNMMIFD